jgi:hypothetical protein
MTSVGREETDTSEVKKGPAEAGRRARRGRVRIPRAPNSLLSTLFHVPPEWVGISLGHAGVNIGNEKRASRDSLVGVSRRPVTEQERWLRCGEPLRGDLCV